MASTSGDLSASGTIANLEALWVARHARPDGLVLASSQAHYTHGRMCEVLGLPFKSVPVDGAGRMDMDALEDALKRERVATVVATLGNTALGAVDPLHEMVKLRDKYGFRLHVDAAYGGYFTLVDNLSVSARAAYDAASHADSIVVDPHKHGLQPYGCGCVLFRDPAVGRYYKHDSPYTYFTSAELHLGEISLECSRAGAAAVALWATQKLLPMTRGGEFAKAWQPAAPPPWNCIRRWVVTIVSLQACHLNSISWCGRSRPRAASRQGRGRKRCSTRPPGGICISRCSRCRNNWRVIGGRSSRRTRIP